MIELKKRIITSIFLIILLYLMYIYNYILIISLIVISLIVWIEFFGIILKIFYKNDLKNKIYRLFFKGLSLIYLSLLSFLIIFIFINQNDFKFFAIYSFLVAIASDIGGIPEIVKGNGVLIKHINKQKLEYALVDLINNSSKRKSLQRKSWANFKFTAKKSSRKLDMYREKIFSDTFVHK